MEPESIVVKGAREHNLKDVFIEIPKKSLVVFTGVSGSGKSSMAFDTLYAEGQRRYVESLSAYARQFLGQMEKPKYDWIRGLSPTISIEQKAASRNPRSTVGTITEIADYLRVLFARVGAQHCHLCAQPVGRQTAQQVTDELMRLPQGTRFMLLSPLIVERKGEHRDVMAEALRQGFTRARIDGAMTSLEEPPALDKKRKHTVEIVVDRLAMKPDLRPRLSESVETALKAGGGVLVLHVPGEDDRIFSEHLACHRCGVSFPDLAPQLFSFNNPLGMCVECNGLGRRSEFDDALIVPDGSLTLHQGAIVPWAGPLQRRSGWSYRLISQAARAFGISMDAPWDDLPGEAREVMLHGSGGREFEVKWQGRRSAGTLRTRLEGVVPALERRFKETHSEDMRRWYSGFMRDVPCRACRGGRLRPEAAAVRVGPHTVTDLSRMTIAEAHRSIHALGLEGNRATIAAELVKEIGNRLSFLLDVGLDYLTLDRLGPTLSGGESQRIRLASQVGSELTGVLYILDEPSIGLHQRDNRRLIATLKHLRDVGNSVLVVEHDQETIEEADHVVDFGPGAGRLGGEVVFSGPPSAIGACEASLTGAYLSGRRRIELPAERRRPGERWLRVEGARENNLRNVDVPIPIGCLVAITGVSGAGKSSLINRILSPALANHFHGAGRSVGLHDRIAGLQHLDKVIDIDQSPIGRTPRSNPATYTKVFDDIREVFASTKEAQVRGYSAGRFSFNVKGGRCETCKGDGYRTVEMHFLADVLVPCEVCRGRRFNDATLQVTYQGRTIAEVLDASITDARELFRNHRRISRILETLEEVGLGYLQLGQPSTTLSGGEAQRIKLSRELAKIATGDTLYLLDEPTTGLHFEDVRKLIDVLGRLVAAGNTVVVIEHNLDVVKTADWVVDLGPEGGDRGGQVIACGTPEEVATTPSSHTGRYLKEILHRSPAIPVATRPVEGGGSPRRARVGPRQRPGLMPPDDGDGESDGDDARRVEMGEAPPSGGARDHATEGAGRAVAG
ncbi:excinuclease ABC subunit UvrA [Myxococcota bacterium]|nr:excinuclease ABC subunit UvrA [Myxococcota bacterium]